MMKNSMSMERSAALRSANMLPKHSLPLVNSLTELFCVRYDPAYSWLNLIRGAHFAASSFEKRRRPSLSCCFWLSSSGLSLFIMELDRLLSLYLARSWLVIMYSTRPAPGRRKSIITHAMVAEGLFLSTKIMISAAIMLNMYSTVMNFIYQLFSASQAYARKSHHDA